MQARLLQGAAMRNLPLDKARATTQPADRCGVWDELVCRLVGMPALRWLRAASSAYRPRCFGAA